MFRKARANFRADWAAFKDASRAVREIWNDDWAGKFVVCVMLGLLGGGLLLLAIWAFTLSWWCLGIGLAMWAIYIGLSNVARWWALKHDRWEGD